MITKKVHYFWLGGRPKDKLTEVCLKTWKDKMPDYEFIEWNEHNLDLEKIAEENTYFAECKKRNLYAFMVDYLRIKILYEQGGIYIDTDVQAIKSLDPLLNNELLLGFEEYNLDNMHVEKIGAGLIGAEKNNWFIKKVYDFYNNEIMNSDKYIITDILIDIYNNLDKEDKDKIHVFSKDFFAPFDSSNCIEFKSDLITENTYTVHWYSFSWKSFKSRRWLQVKHIKNPIERNLKILKNWNNFRKETNEVKKNIKYKS